MNNLSLLRDKYYKETKIQRQGAWNEKNFKRACEIRKKEKINYEKWKLLDGIIKAQERERLKNGKDEGTNNRIPKGNNSYKKRNEEKNIRVRKGQKRSKGK